MMISLISDTHNNHEFLKLPGGDILICAGDISSVGHPRELGKFFVWFGNQDYEYKIFIAGNHDFTFQTHPESAKKLVELYDIIYLEDSYVIIDINGKKLKIYGSPWQPEFYNWAFNLPRNSVELEEKWAAIPDDTDILITHGPPYGILDTSRNKNLGCEKLRDRVLQLNNLKLHTFGHIHNGYGAQVIGSTTFVNASVLNDKYQFRSIKPSSINISL